MSCAVVGVLARPDARHVERRMRELFEASAERGRDSAGLAWWDGERVVRVVSTDGTWQPLSVKPLAAVGNRRAEPTTEWVPDKQPGDVQPFQMTDSGWIYSHNGTIANDRDLAKPGTRIDSAVIGPLLDAHGFAGMLERLRGSFAIVAWWHEHPERLYVACNYKPLFAVQRDRAIYVASQAHYLTERGSLATPQPTMIPPYSQGWLELDKPVHVASLYPTHDWKALAVCSGGLDSTVAAWHMQRKGYDVELVHFDYGCKAGSRERQAVNEIASAMDVPAHIISTGFFGAHATSSLTDPRREIVAGFDGEEGAEYGHEWVPARNLVMMSMALALAEAREANTVVLGNNLEESGGGYPDNEQEFVNRLQALTPFALRPYHQVAIEQPVGTLMKHEIVRLGLAEEAPLELTWSCYLGGRRHCGSCGPCFMRRRAFEMAGERDPAFATESTLATLGRAAGARAGLHSPPAPR